MQNHERQRRERERERVEPVPKGILLLGIWDFCIFFFWGVWICVVFCNFLVAFLYASGGPGGGPGILEVVLKVLVVRLYGSVR